MIRTFFFFSFEISDTYFQIRIANSICGSKDSGTNYIYEVYQQAIKACMGPSTAPKWTWSQCIYCVVFWVMVQSHHFSFGSSKMAKRSWFGAYQIANRSFLLKIFRWKYIFFVSEFSRRARLMINICNLSSKFCMNDPNYIVYKSIWMNFDADSKK